MSETIGYAIRSENKAGETFYMATDHSSGGYKYWSNSFKNCDMFTYEEALSHLKSSSCFTKYDVCGNHRFPPRMIQMGAKTNYDNPTGYVKIYIMKIELEPVYSTMFDANITEVKDENSQR